MSDSVSLLPKHIQYSYVDENKLKFRRALGAGAFLVVIICSLFFFGGQLGFKQGKVSSLIADAPFIKTSSIQSEIRADPLVAGKSHVGVSIDKATDIATEGEAIIDKASSSKDNDISSNMKMSENVNSMEPLKSDLGVFYSPGQIVQLSNCDLNAGNNLFELNNQNGKNIHGDAGCKLVNELGDTVVPYNALSIVRVREENVLTAIKLKILLDTPFSNNLLGMLSTTKLGNIYIYYENGGVNIVSSIPSDEKDVHMASSEMDSDSATRTVTITYSVA
eukprot:CAMPEP_0182416834 /NCGR_PEP_ID=MMETSP1167-20130531/1208_1 /TAXON_ID=2988 /ORGANISM="Mallomonas Sp, Strain CCMP3275" /LENGTH=276 /DNA_ID=CAMNT_0024589943 /DNA_START=76 /DNA_END=906 /DNA_ORIENTATION=-